MIAHTTVPILILVVAKTCFANRRPIVVTQRPAVFLTPDPSAKPSNHRPGSKSRIHISEFTDPDTGLNPFVDVQEGQTGAFGRRTVDQARPFPLPRQVQVELDSNIMEGSAENSTKTRFSNSSPRWPHKAWLSGKSQNTETQRQLGTENGQRMIFSKNFVDKTLNNFDDIFTDEPFPSENYTTSSLTTEATFSDVTTTSSSTSDVSTVTSDKEKSVPSSPRMIILVISLASIFVVGFVAVFVFCWKERSRNIHDITQRDNNVEPGKDSDITDKGNESFCRK